MTQNWRGAAVLGLGRLGEKSQLPRFLAIIDDLKHPLAAALVALGDLNELRALPKIYEDFNARNTEILTASAPAGGKLAGFPTLRQKMSEIGSPLCSLMVLRLKWRGPPPFVRFWQ